MWSGEWGVIIELYDKGNVVLRIHAPVPRCYATPSDADSKLSVGDSYPIARSGPRPRCVVSATAMQAADGGTTASARQPAARAGERRQALY